MEQKKEQKDDLYDFDTTLFTPDEARRYWTIVARVNRLDKDDETRVLVEAPVLMTTVNLREMARMVSEIKTERQAVDAQKRSINEALKRFELLIKDRNELEEKWNWDLRSQTLAHMIADVVTEIVQAEIKQMVITSAKSVQTDVKK